MIETHVGKSFDMGSLRGGANQRGGVKGRQLADAVLDIEAHAQLDCRLAATFPATLLFDFAAALPAIN